VSFRKGGTGVYGLTATKVQYWHRLRDCEGVVGNGLWHVLSEHLEPAGFTVVGGACSRNYLDLRGARLEDGWTDLLYQAVSGSAGFNSDRDPARRWKF